MFSAAYRGARAFCRRLRTASNCWLIPAFVGNLCSTLGLCGLPPNCVYAGLYHRPIADETLKPVPHWSTFFDTVIPKLRSFAPPDPRSRLPPSSLRQKALQRITRFAQQSDRTLTADDFVDWSGWLLRSMSIEGRPTIEDSRRVLERARSLYPRDYRLAAHLATVYQLSGEYDRALALAQEALDLAPPQVQQFERYHLRLILQRRFQDRERRLGKISKDEACLDDLFGVRWWEQGILRSPGVKTLDLQLLAAPQTSADFTTPPAEAGEVLQQFLIWFPFDGQLWWLLGEYLVAQQDWRFAEQAFQAASDLRLGGKIFRQRRAQVLEQAERLRAKTEMPGIPELPVLEPAGDPSRAPPWWSRFGWSDWTLLALGGTLLVLLAGWQVRIWARQLMQR